MFLVERNRCESWCAQNLYSVGVLVLLSESSWIILECWSALCRTCCTLPKQLSLSSLAAKEWIGQRRENIRPWALFINTAHLRAPSSLPRLSKRVVKNIEYFNSNYFFVFLGLIAYCLITSPFLLIAVAASLGACYILSQKNSERKISFMGHELTLVQQYGLIAVCSFPIFYLAGAGAALFWVLGTSFFIIALHASFYNIDAILIPEEDRFDLVIEEV